VGCRTGSFPFAEKEKNKKIKMFGRGPASCTREAEEDFVYSWKGSWEEAAVLYKVGAHLGPLLEEAVHNLVHPLHRLQRRGIRALQQHATHTIEHPGGEATHTHTHTHTQNIRHYYRLT
jgi:hypothetical protein